MPKLKVGDEVGSRYRIQGFLNQGGMQEVYKAQDLVLDRLVALKTPIGSSAAQRFARSARLSARVNHSNVARTFDYLMEGDQEYLIEELVDGFDLGTLLVSCHRLDPDAVARILHSLARAFSVIHRLDMAHRDLKPSNVMVEGGFAFKDIKVTDFGVCKMAADEIDRGTSGAALGMTGSKTLIGHLPYMAPEVLRRKNLVEPKADVWAIGALAFHLLTGSPPFGSELADAVMNILTSPIPDLPNDLSSHAQWGPAALEIYGVILACLQRDVSRRIDAGQLLTQCRRLCYSAQREDRVLAKIVRYPSPAFGFAVDEEGNSLFFHRESVVGDLPSIGTEVWCARYPGHPYDRVHPVVPIVSG